jgi:hypothetical protein
LLFIYHFLAKEIGLVERSVFSLSWGIFIEANFVPIAALLSSGRTLVPNGETLAPDTALNSTALQA